MGILKVPEVLVDIFYFIFISFKAPYLYLIAFYRLIIPPNAKSLEGKVIIVTGSASGIGQEICRQLAKTGAILVCLDIDKDGNDSFVKRLIVETGVKAFPYQLDISDKSKVKAVLTRVREEVGDIQVLINNVGVMSCKPFLKQSADEFEMPFKVNCLGQMWILKEILPRMIELNEGHVVTVCSVSGLLPMRNLAIYSAAMHALNGFIEALKEEVRHDERKPNIQFTTIYPFANDSRLMAGVSFKTRFPALIKLSNPEKVAAKLVEGLRRNYEHVYIPSWVSFAGITKILIPQVQRLGGDFIRCEFKETSVNGNTNPEFVTNEGLVTV